MTNGGTTTQTIKQIAMPRGKGWWFKSAGSAANFGTVLRIAHNLIKTYPENISIKRKRKKADRSDMYREKILRLQT
jgi:hypothetical protein